MATEQSVSPWRMARSATGQCYYQSAPEQAGSQKTAEIVYVPPVPTTEVTTFRREGSPWRMERGALGNWIYQRA